MKYILSVQWKDGISEEIYFPYISQAKNYAEKLLLRREINSYYIYVMVDEGRHV